MAARIGRLKTRHGVIETPYIFPVVDPTMRHQLVDLNDIKNVGFNGIITNAYLLKKSSNGLTRDVHEVLGFEGVVMTDSGAYQILRYGSIDVTNREIVQYQCDIGSDIGVILDIPTPYHVGYEDALKSAEITLQRAIEVRDIIESCRETLWTLPIQGGVYSDILRAYAIKSNDVIGLGYSIYALGSPTTLLENYMLDKVIEMVFTVRSSIMSSYPLHLFGAGHPLIIPFAVAAGVDLMDSASYILYARNGRYITRKATYRLRELHYLPCSCPVCSKYSVEELMELPKNELQKLLALHNLYTLFNELKEVKKSIKEGRLWEYLEEKSRAHPAAKRAFDVFKKYIEYVYSRSPYNKPRGKAVFILSEDSVYNPRILIARRKIGLVFQLKKKCAVFMPIIKYQLSDSKVQEVYSNSIVNRLVEHCDTYFYHPVIGVIPEHLMGVYPFSQFESYIDFSLTVLKDLVYLFTEYVLKVGKNGNVLKVYLISISDVPWQKMFAEMIREYAYYLGRHGISVEVVELR